MSDGQRSRFLGYESEGSPRTSCVTVCAVALLQAGIDVSVIRDYLGHASVATTSRYITTNLQMKREVLEAFWKRSGLDSKAPRKWRPSPKLLAFLESLWRLI